MSSGAQNMKTGPGAIGIAQNESESAKLEKWDTTPSVPPKTSPGAQNKKMGPDALGTVENEFGSAKYANGTRRLRLCRKHVREGKTCKQDPTPSVPPQMSSGAQDMKMGHNALGTAENESAIAKHKNGTRHLRYSLKRVRERKT
jgi:hypothetical protein